MAASSSSSAAAAVSSSSSSSIRRQSTSSGSLPSGGKVAPESKESVRGGAMYEADASCYRVTSIIGEGYMCASTVYLGQHVPTNRQVTVKCIELDAGTGSGSEEYDGGASRRLSQAISELRMTQFAQHPHIIAHHVAFIHCSQLWVVAPYYDRGSVRDVLDTCYYDGLQPELALACVLRQLVRALHYLHSTRIVHRSVKASHLLLTSAGHVTLTGLKYAALLERDSGLPTDHINHFSGPHMEANLYWLSPQILAQNVSGYSSKSDMYSVGIVACEMANGLVPFCEMEPTKMFKEKLDGTVPKLIDRSTFPPLPNGGEDGEGVGQEDSDMERRHAMLQERVFTKAFHDLVAQCLALNEEERPTAAEALSSQFLKSHVKQGRECLVQALRNVQPQLHHRDVQQQQLSVAEAVELQNLSLSSDSTPAQKSGEAAAAGTSDPVSDSITDTWSGGADQWIFAT